MTKMVNSLTAKMELGAPMISMYLLGQPDHYTSHRFNNFFWEAFVREVEKDWSLDDAEVGSSKVLLVKIQDRLRVLPVTYDYIFRGSELEELCLYDWIARCKHEKVKNTMIEKIFGDATFFYMDNSGDDCAGESRDVKKSTSKRRTNLYPFLKDHPLSSTHAT